MPCRASVCDNSAAPFDGRAVLHAPSPAMAASSGLDAARLLSLWAAGARFADSHGACLFGHTDAANANATESAPFLATEFSAGACVPLSSCRWGAAHFICACVSAAKAREAHALVAHHARHHAQLAAATLLAAAAAWLLVRRAHAARHPAFVALVCLGGLLLLRGSAPLAPAEGYWQGCGAEAEAVAGGLRFRSLAGEAA